MTERDTNEHTTEERIFAAISHAAIVLPYVGVAVPLGVWIAQREKSSWVSFQALQAMAYQTLQYVLMMIFGCLAFPMFLGGLFIIPDTDSFFGFSMLLPFLPYMFWGLLILLGLLGGVLCAFGKNFRYPLIGRKIQKYITNHSLEAVLGGDND